MYERLVDPRRLLRVMIEEPTGEREVTAYRCAYVPALSPQGTTSVAVEIVWDPATPNPSSAYSCPEDRFERRVLSPTRVKKIRPYISIGS
jgi:hypothetical protein